MRLDAAVRLRFRLPHAWFWMALPLPLVLLSPFWILRLVRILGFTCLRAVLGFYRAPFCRCTTLHRRGFPLPVSLPFFTAPLPPLLLARAARHLLTAVLYYLLCLPRRAVNALPFARFARLRTAALPGLHRLDSFPPATCYDLYTLVLQNAASRLSAAFHRITATLVLRAARCLPRLPLRFHLSFLL